MARFVGLPDGDARDSQLSGDLYGPANFVIMDDRHLANRAIRELRQIPSGARAIRWPATKSGHGG